MEENIENTENNELFEHYKVIVDPGQAQLRVDKFLMDKVENTSRNKLQEAATAGNIHVNSIAVKSNYKVKPGDVVQIVLEHPPREIELIPQDIPIEILYEDDDLILVNKPAGLVVHPGYGNYSGTLVNALVYHFENLPNQSELGNRPGLVHRIDKNTSGILVIAKTEASMTHLAKQFFDRTIDRRYLALVWGDVKEDGIVKTNLGRSLKNRKVMDVFPFEGEIGKHAITRYKVLQSFGYVTLVECKLETGRTHQIRVHMKSIGHPLFNDPEYGGSSVLKGKPTANYRRFVQNCFDLIPGQALHARSLTLDHPSKKGEVISYESELPEGFKAIIERFKKVQD
jgi:23S rRNA pseudouridine1911/1915/1917 synthase